MTSKHLEEGGTYLHFFKSREKFNKAALGAAYNLASRVLAGVIAGWVITTYFTPPQTQQQIIVEPSAIGAIVGATTN